MPRKRPQGARKSDDRRSIRSVKGKQDRCAVEPVDQFYEGGAREVELNGGFAGGFDGFVDHQTVLSEMLAQDVVMYVARFVFVFAVDLDDLRTHVEVDHNDRESLNEWHLLVRYVIGR
jgi:hypothetical protein